MANDRIPPGVRKEINKIGPGKYLDPVTRRIYVDSADMDGAFDQMIDDTRAADEKRDAEHKARMKALPPQHVMEQAYGWQLAHAERVLQQHEDTTGWRKRASGRREHLLARQASKRELGSDLDPEDLEELDALDDALGPPRTED